MNMKFKKLFLCVAILLSATAANADVCPAGSDVKVFFTQDGSPAYSLRTDSGWTSVRGYGLMPFWDPLSFKSATILSIETVSTETVSTEADPITGEIRCNYVEGNYSGIFTMKPPRELSGMYAVKDQTMWVKENQKAEYKCDKSVADCVFIRREAVASINPYGPVLSDKGKR